MNAFACLSLFIALWCGLGALFLAFSRFSVPLSVCARAGLDFRLFGVALASFSFLNRNRAAAGNRSEFPACHAGDVGSIPSLGAAFVTKDEQRLSR